MTQKQFKYLVGIDEAGRGPLAGPVAVGAVAMSRPDLDIRVRDSKQLSARQRDFWYGWLSEQQKKNELKFAVVLVSEKIIDREGVNKAIALGIKRCLQKLAVSGEKCRVLLDGGLRAPKEFTDQKTIIKGDEKEAIIALASIVAKVIRDRKMLALHKLYPAYDFARHKGYGTTAHYRALKKHGSSPIHRRSFLKKLHFRFSLAIL